MSKPYYDTTLARIAGNIAAGLVSRPEHGATFDTMELAVMLAEDIVERCKKLGLKSEPPDA